MDLIKLFMGILLIICLILCTDYKTLSNTIEEHYPELQHPKTSCILGLKVREFKGKIRVDEVFEYTPAAKSGIETGDKIIEIEGEKITNLENYNKILSELHDKTKINMKIYRTHSRSFFPVEVEKHP